jgi:hypothetical protein
LSEISEKAKVRLLGGGADKPSAPPPSSSAQLLTTTDPVPAPDAPMAAKPVFLSDSADGADILDAASVVLPLAQLCVTPQVQTPFLAAIAGPGGSGKSFALKRLADAIERLSGSSGALARVVVAQVDAAGAAEAPVALASAAYAALDREPGGVDYSALLDESAHAGGDPLRAAQAASERHDEIVRKLEAERSQRDEVEARRARIADALLFETPGSRVDVFARGRRGAIEARLRRFELAGPDAAVSYRDFVRDMAGMGPGGRAGVALRSIWAYGSQRRLLFWAIVAFAVGFGLNVLHGETALSTIRSIAPPLASVADWIAAHAGWFEKAAEILYALGLLALLLNIWRALSFSSLLFRGATLLNHDARDRRRDLETRAARLNQRVARPPRSTPKPRRGARAARRRRARRGPTSSTHITVRQRQGAPSSLRSANAWSRAPRRGLPIV